MASLTDHELIHQILLGNNEAMGDLFDRYAGSIYDFLTIVVGDPDEAARLLTDVFARFPRIVADIPDHESIRGPLFSLARERALFFLDQRGWLEALPLTPSIVASFSDLVNDIWRATRAMPASHRATLAIAEHQPLSPMEMAIALGVMRTALPELVADARLSFNEQFDLIARTEGKPLVAQINADMVPGLQRQVPDPDASLLAFLPILAMTPNVRARLRDQIVATVAQPMAIIPPSQTIQPVVPITSSRTIIEEETYGGGSNLIPVLTVGIILALCAAFLVAAFALSRRAQPASAESNAPVIQQIIPENGAILPPTRNVVVQALYTDPRGVDPSTVQLIIDGRDVTQRSSVSATAISYNAELAPGNHVVVLTLKNTAGVPATLSWRFTIGVPPSATPTPFLSPTSTPIPTLTFTPLPTLTPAPSSTPAPTLTLAPTATLAPTSTRAPTPTLAPTSTPQPTPVLPDLVVTDITLSPNAQIVYVVRNTGAGDVTQPFLIEVFVDTVLVDSSRRVSSLGSGQEISLTVPNYTLTGTHMVTVLLNPNQEVKETNYNNNQLIRTLSGPNPTPAPPPSPTP